MPGQDQGPESAFLDALMERRLLIPSGVPGVYGRGAVFEDVLEHLDRFITEATRDDGAEVVRFPPAINRRHFELSEYLQSLPHLAGSVFSFAGTPAEHMLLLSRAAAGEDWSGLQKMTDVVLTPAACYPLYPMATGVLPASGRLFDVSSYCFRHEPSEDPARMQMFRMRELVRMGEADTVLPWRDLWVERGRRMMHSLGLPVEAEVASDPFFGRGGRLLATNQRDQRLKLELSMPICSAQGATSLMSFNYHQDHFGGIFGIETRGGEAAHTACLGFGMERVVLGLLKTHGFVPSEWPSEVRGKLWP